MPHINYDKKQMENMLLTLLNIPKTFSRHSIGLTRSALNSLNFPQGRTIFSAILIYICMYRHIDRVNEFSLTAGFFSIFHKENVVGNL